MDTDLSEIIKNKLKNIRFWILLFFIVRLIGITNPPLDVAHNWRQTTVTMSARNFYETNSNIFYPRIDIAGEKTGITGMEFPALNYLIYLISLVFGYAHWYGRLINLAISSLGILFFYKMVAKYFTASHAFNAAFILLFSVWFTYSRKIMPDTFSMSLLFIGLYYGSQYLDIQNSIRNLLLSLSFILLGTLSKLPSAYLLVVYIPLLLNPSIPSTRKIIFAGTTGISLILVAAYYFVWVPNLNVLGGFEHFFMGEDLISGFKAIISQPFLTFEKFYLEALQVIGFLLFLGGIYALIIQPNKTLTNVFLLSLTGFIVLMLKAGFAFYHHSYYIIPFAPVMALVAAYALECIPRRRVSTIILIFICIESLANKFHDFYIKDDYKEIIQLETELDKLGPRSELILINSGNVPTPMYFAHRKGWLTFNDRLQRKEYIDSLKNLGLKHIVVLEKVFGESTELPYVRRIQNTNFTIYSP